MKLLISMAASLVYTVYLLALVGSFHVYIEKDFSWSELVDTIWSRDGLKVATQIWAFAAFWMWAFWSLWGWMK